MRFFITKTTIAHITKKSYLCKKILDFQTMKQRILFVCLENKVSNITINRLNTGVCSYDNRGNMTKNTEAGLEISYNLCFCQSKLLLLMAQ